MQRSNLFAFVVLFSVTCSFSARAQDGGSQKGGTAPVPAEAPTANAENPVEGTVNDDGQVEPGESKEKDAPPAAPKTTGEVEPPEQNPEAPKGEPTTPAAEPNEAAPLAEPATPSPPTEVPAASTAQAADPAPSAPMQAPPPAATVAPLAPKDPSACGVCVSFKRGKGIKIASGDNAFALYFRPRVQLRLAIARDGSDNDVTLAFMIRRARLAMTGHMFGEDLKFKAELAFSPNDVGIKNGAPTLSPLLDWYVHSAHFRDFNVRAGQYKVSYSRQRVVSSGNLQLVDRSLAQGEFNLDRDVGAEVFSKDVLGLKMFRYSAGIHIGEGRDAFVPGDLGLLYLARAEFLPLGWWSGTFKDDYKEVDLERRTRPQVSLGMAYGFLDEAKGNRGIKGSTPADGGTTDTHNVTADLMAKWYGFSLFAEGFGRYGTRNPGTEKDENGDDIPIEVARNGIGASVQAGYLVPVVDLELAGRYSLVRPVLDSSLKGSDEVGLGFSYYFGGHSLKIQTDVSHRFSDYDLVGGRTEFRTQLQAAF